MSEDENKRQYQFGEKLRAVRERKHLTLKAVAAHAKRAAWLFFTM